MKRKIIAISAAVCLLMLLFFAWPMDMGSLTAGVMSAYVAFFRSRMWK